MFNFSERANRAKASEIREILKLIEQPEIISFAGGLPAPELFPVNEILKMTTKVLEEDPYQALQYATTEGYNPLREAILNQRLRPYGMNGSLDNILITSGSQQALDYLGKIFINEGDVILCECPSYLGALQAFSQYGAKFIEIKMDDEGIVIEDLRKAILDNPNVKLIYTIPDFQNPSGKYMSLERRKELLKIVEEFNIPLVEDSPYGELILEGDKIPSIKSFDTKGYVIYLGTFSKTFCPGLRTGWVFAHKDIIDKLVKIKQASDLQCSSLDQRIIGYYLQNYDLNEHIEKIKSVYKNRRKAMLDTMEKYFPKDVNFTHSKGGLFIWVQVNDDIDTVKLLEDAIKENVAFVPGASFFPNGGYHNFFRLNYSNMPEDRIIDGIQRLAKVLNKYY